MQISLFLIMWRELDFYSAILTTGESPLWRDDLTNNLGNPIIGIGARTAEYDALPLQWMPHFQVADVATSASSARAMGGKELFHGKTDEGQSQWAVLTDPNGAAFGIIPAGPGESGNAQPTGRFGCISWLSITVPDALAIRDFYQQVVGCVKPLQTEQSKEHSDRFEMQIDEETSAAEIRQASSGDNDIPAIWLIHLPVGDIAESLRRVQECGGQVIKKSAEAGCAVVRDPVGVCFALPTG